jgi:hypothetical protein
MWIDKAERILQTHNLHNLINKSIPRPMKNNPDGQKWKTLSKQVRSWPANSFGRQKVPAETIRRPASHLLRQRLPLLAIWIVFHWPGKKQSRWPEVEDAVEASEKLAGE